MEQTDRPKTFVEFYKRFGWTQHAGTKDKRGFGVPADSPNLDSACLLGAGYYLDNCTAGVHWNAVQIVVREHYHRETAAFNDERGRTMEDICKVAKLTDEYVAKNNPQPR